MKNIADDVWFEIFLHLPLTSIFKFKCISKVWSSILSGPNFINKWYQLNYSSLPWAMIDFAVDRSPDTNKLRRNFAISCPDTHSQFFNDHQNGFSFNFLDPDFENSSNDEEEWKEIYIRSSSNGLVLCSIELSNPKVFYVCNPLTQKWVLLPPPPTQGQGVASLICNECFSSSLISTGYKVIVIPKFEAAAKEFKVEVFCSDFGEWNTYVVSRPPNVTWQASVGDIRLTYNGVFYWFQRTTNRILALSVNGNTTNHGTLGIECRLINLPDQAYMSRSLGESEGLICYANIVEQDRERSLSVWVLGEDWYLLHRDVRFNDMLELMESQLVGGATTVDLIAEIRVLGFNPFDKNVVILGCRDNLLAYNTRTRAYEQLYHPSLECSILGAKTFSFKPRPTVLQPLSGRDS